MLKKEIVSKKLFAPAVIIFMVTLFISCDLNGENLNGENVQSFEKGIVGTLGADFTIRSSVSRSINGITSRSINSPSVEEMWLVAIHKGVDSVIYPGTVATYRAIEINENGSFSLDTSEVQVNTDYIILLVDTFDEDKRNHVKGFLALKIDEETNLCSFPLDDIDGILDMGEISLTGDEAVSENSLSDNADVFTAENIALCVFR